LSTYRKWFRPDELRAFGRDVMIMDRDWRDRSTDGRVGRLHLTIMRFDLEGVGMDFDSDQFEERIVAVGVEGSAESVAAARYAVQAASQRGFDLLLVHAYDLPSVHVPVDSALLDAFQESAHRLVANVAAQLVVPSTMRIQTSIQPALSTELLLLVARRVPLLVVGQDHLTWGERMTFGRVASQVAQRSNCPVVVVPGSWRESPAGSDHPVVVALHEDSSAAAALRLAFEQAELLDTWLMALLAAPGRSHQTKIADEAASLTEQLAGWKQDYPGVRVKSEVVVGEEDASLLQWSKSAAVLVVERPHRHWWNSWTHSVVGSVLQQTQCPLIVVPHEHDSAR
jgi:nucleotide-binding universal stress UspA family protein